MLPLFFRFLKFLFTIESLFLHTIFLNRIVVRQVRSVTAAVSFVISETTPAVIWSPLQHFCFSQEINSCLVYFLFNFCCEGIFHISFFFFIAFFPLPFIPFIPPYRWVDTKAVVHLHNGILVGRKKEETFTLCDNMDGHGEHRTKQNKLVRERQIPCDFTQWTDWTNKQNNYLF